MSFMVGTQLGYFKDRGCVGQMKYKDIGVPNVTLRPVESQDRPE